MASVAMLCLAPVTISAAKSERAEPVRVTGVRYWSTGNVTRVAVEVSGPFRYTTDRISNPERLFFDLRNTKPDMVRKGIHLIPVADTQVGQIRVAETIPNVTRIVLDLRRPVSVTTSQLSSPNRLIVELRGIGELVEPMMEKPAPVLTTGLREPAVRMSEAPVETPRAEIGSEPVKPEPIKIEPKKPEPRKFELPPLHAAKPRPAMPEPMLPSPPLIALAKPMRIPEFPRQTIRHFPPPEGPVLEAPAVSTGSRIGHSPIPAKGQDGSLTRLLGLKLGRIVLDAGHGGVDQGTHGPSGYLEKDLVLDVTRRLGEMLSDRMGAEVIYTRFDDSYVPLEERTKIANQRKADLFLSIHANSSSYRAAAGIETFVLNFTPSKAANEVAARENASSNTGMHELRSLVEKIAQSDKANESREFAVRLQSPLSALSTKSVDEARNRGIKTAPFVVLIGATMPSVLTEIGFLTNPDEEALLRKADYRQKIAEALFRGISAYSETLSRFDVARKD